MIAIADLLNKLKLDKLDKKKIFLLVLAGIVILYLDFALLLKLQFKWIKDISPKIVKLKSDIGNLVKDLANMQDLQTKEARMKQGGALRVKKIISEEQIPLLLQHISDLANKNNVSIIKILPSKELKPKEEKASGNVVKVGLVSITLDLSCSYHNLGKFINDLENIEEFVAVEEMKITRGTYSDYLTENVNLVLKTYVRR